MSNSSQTGNRAEQLPADQLRAAQQPESQQQKSQQSAAQPSKGQPAGEQHHRAQQPGISPGMLEHVNVTVSDPLKTATLLCELFDWHIRWQGDSIHGGTTVHVGSDTSYVAVYSMGRMKDARDDSYATRGGLNHIGVVVSDLDAVEQRVLTRGFKTHSHADYEPGRRFYFRDADMVEFEVVSYSQ